MRQPSTTWRRPLLAQGLPGVAVTVREAGEVDGAAAARQCVQEVADDRPAPAGREDCTECSDSTQDGVPRRSGAP